MINEPGRKWLVQLQHGMSVSYDDGEIRLHDINGNYWTFNRKDRGDGFKSQPSALEDGFVIPLLEGLLERRKPNFDKNLAPAEVEG